MTNSIQTRTVFTVRDSQGVNHDFEKEAEAAMASILITLGVWGEDICDVVMINLNNNLDAIQVNLKKIQTGGK